VTQHTKKISAKHLTSLSLRGFIIPIKPKGLANEGKQEMTRKDYELIAGVISSMYKDFDCSPAEDTVSLSAIADGLADALKNTNPRFDRDIFLTACGVK